MQLVAYGAQDIYLTGNPQITFFKVVYRRHTNFSMETIQQTINGSSTITTTATSGTVTVSRNGDLVSKVYVKCAQAGATTTQIAGDRLIQDVEVEIGGQRIDKHYQEWMQVWTELTTPASKAAGTKYMTGGFSNTLLTQGGTGQNVVQVPLQFWFCRNPGLALPLIALQYHEVKLKFTWAASSSGTGPGRDDSGSVVPTCEVWCDYIYLDTDERRRFAQVSHEYLIEQLQLQTESSAEPSSIKLNFNHPIKELIWTNTETKIGSQKARLVLNGHDRFAEQNREYFQLRQPLDYHTSVPGFNVKETERATLLNPPIVIGGLSLGQAAGTPPTTSLPVEIDQSDADYVSVFSTTHTPKPGDIFVVQNSTGGATKAYSFTGTVKSVSSSSNIHDITPVEAVANTPAVDTSANDETTYTCLARVQDPKSNCSQLDRNINIYSFALKPEEHQPSGTCNFSRIDNAKLEFSGALTTDTTAAAAGDGTDVTAQNINVYAVNYNVLRIMSGMGGLAYSN